MIALAPPVPVQAAPAVVRSSERLVRWQRSPVLCGGAGDPMRTEPVALSVDPVPVMGWAGSMPQTITLAFRIDASGRPLGIVREGTGFVPFAEDVQPALAATRFAAGADRPRCTVTFTQIAAPVDAAPVEALMAYTVFPSQPPSAAVWRRVRPAGSDCVDPTPEVRLRAFPPFSELPDQPGYRSWSITGFDLDRRGRPIGVHMLASSGTAALDAASRVATSRSRLAPAARHGCLWPYWKAAATLPAPAVPEEDSVRPADATCPRDHAWDRRPVLRYPEPYRRRSIEGWAMVTYDVAPWGETGNIKVLAAEPTAEFGDAAVTMIRAATLPASRTGYVGCVDRVRYVIGKPGAAVAEPTPTPLPPPD